MLRQNDDKDAYLRHAGVMGLVGSGKTAAWMKAIHDPSSSARMGVLLAMRREGDPEVARFLEDHDPPAGARDPNWKLVSTDPA